MAQDFAEKRTWPDLTRPPAKSQARCRSGTGSILIPQVPLPVAVAVPPMGIIMIYSQCRWVVTFAVSAVQEGTTRGVQAQPPRRGGAHGTATPPADPN